MIIIFHYLSIIFFQILRNRKRLKNVGDLSEAQDAEAFLKFDPPVYKQRYALVYQVLLEEKWRNNVKKLVDFGCAEFSLFTYIKNLNIEEILFVDIDENLMWDKIGKVEPLLVDQLRRRCYPLTVYIFRGSVIDPDYRLRKTDVVTAIELIEHLYPDTLEALPYNIFGFIKPKLVIISTPNANFNVVFNRLHGFRHPDHKFEWTEEQFENWSNNLTERFPEYMVEFRGIGELPNTNKTLGHCSQVAIFTLKEGYISPIYAKSCQCDKTAPCKGQTTECKLECRCSCSLCLPDFSVGVCTYLSHNLTESEAFRPMKSFSDTDLRSSKCELYYETFRKRMEHEQNPSYNIFYKLLQSINYPYEADMRSETEKLIDLFTYRINVFSHISSRFYVEERECCEIPVKDIVYGDVDVSVEEVRSLLAENGYKIKKCIIPETGLIDDCIISPLQEMDNITSSSEATESYSTKSSECNDAAKFDSNSSDWDEIFVPQKQTDEAASSTSTSKKPPSDPLCDSGYLKSPSPLEAVPQLPQLSNQETDHFEDIVPTPSLNSDDNRLHLKRNLTKGENSHRVKIDPNRVNELDRVKTFMNNHLRPQTEFKKVPQFKDLSIPGTSSSWKKSKMVPKKTEFKEPTPLDDAKSLTNCIIQNSLNKVVVENEGPHSPLIEDLSPLQAVAEAAQEVAPPVLVQPEAPPPVLPVENGDLANNNRDREGNNLLVVDEQDVDEGIDLLNDNLEDMVLEDNNFIENNNELRIEVVQEAEVEQQAPPRDPVNLVEDAEDLVAGASREALFDENSEQDLLEEFDLPPRANQESLSAVINLDSNVTNQAVSAQVNTGTFPNWLLQLLGSQMIPEEATTTRDEPHFYCQGDGLGVHPSVLAIEIDEAEDADNETTDESSSNNTADFAEVEPGPSDMFDMSSLPEESSMATSVMDEASLARQQESEVNGAFLVDESIRVAQTTGTTIDDEKPGCSTSKQESENNQSQLEYDETTRNNAIELDNGVDEMGSVGIVESSDDLEMSDCLDSSKIVEF